MSAKTNLYITFELGLCKVEGQLMCHRAIGDRGWLCSNSGGGRIAMAIEKAHIPWLDSIAWATVDWGVTISGCGAEELLGTRRGRHVLNVICIVLRGLANTRGSRGAKIFWRKHVKSNR